MKRLIMLALAGFAAVLMTACGENPPKEPTPATEQTQPAATTEPAEQTTTTPATNDTTAPATSTETPAQ